MNEAIRTDETAKETSGKAGRLDTDKHTGRHKDRGNGERLVYISSKLSSS